LRQQFVDSPRRAAGRRSRTRLTAWPEESEVRFLPKLPKPKTKAGKAGMIAGGVIGGLIALDLLALAATAVIAATAGLR